MEDVTSPPFQPEWPCTRTTKDSILSISTCGGVKISHARGRLDIRQTLEDDHVEFAFSNASEFGFLGQDDVGH